MSAHAPSSPSHRRLFGTDGVRGTFGEPPLDENTVRRLGAAVAQAVRRRYDYPAVVLGGDTRDSTPILGSWLIAELQAQGVETTWLGVVPTPAVAAATRSAEASCGIAVSASHNPHPDNGIKLIDGRGFKLSSQAEARIESALDSPTLPEIGARAYTPSAILVPVDDWLDEIAAPLLHGSVSLPLEGMRLCLDVAYGAASAYAGPLFERLGAEVEVLHDRPDGTNINHDAGSTHPEALAERVRSGGFDLGIAFDGDADRALLVDETGTLRDGDAILYLWACDLDDRRALHQRQIVATSMSNLGLEVALQRRGIGLVRCDVGDREVVQTLLSRDLVLGGEQSGHIVHLDHTTTGDGLLTGAHVAAIVCRSGGRLSERLEGFERFPQILRSIEVEMKPDLETLPRVVEARRAIEDELGDEGRLVLRYSGTEPKARIMLEGRDRATIEPMADRLEEAIRHEIDKAVRWASQETETMPIPVVTQRSAAAQSSGARAETETEDLRQEKLP